MRWGMRPGFSWNVTCVWVCVYVWVLAHHDPINIGPPLCRLALFPWVHLHHLEPSITLLLYGSRDKHDSFLSLSFCPSLFISISSYPSLSFLLFCFLYSSIHPHECDPCTYTQAVKKKKNNLLKSVSSSTLRCCIALITFATHTDTQTHQQASDQGYCLPLGLRVCTWLCVCAFVLVCVCVCSEPLIEWSRGRFVCWLHLSRNRPCVLITNLESILLSAEPWR